jgi:AraC-like DNA-binding protein
MKSLICLFPEPPVNTPEFRVKNLSIHENMTPQECTFIGLHDYLLMFFYHDMSIRGKGQIQHIPRQSLIIWEPQTDIYYSNTQKKWSYSWIYFGGSNIRKLLSKCGLETNKALLLEDISIVEKYIMDIHNELTTHIQPNATIVFNIFHNWFLELTRQLKGQDHPETISPEYIKLKKYLEAHYHKKISLEEMASQVCHTVPHFCSTFKKYFGFSAIDYIIRIRMHQAAYLLHNPKLSISEIARTVGYDDLYYFSSQFKKHYKASPRGMRKSLFLK